MVKTMRNRLLVGLVILSLVSLATSYVYQCEPGTDPTVCSIWNFRYDPDDKILPVVNVSVDVKKFRFNIEYFYYDSPLDIKTYDSALHSTVLHNPTTVVVLNNRVREVVIPTNLQTGEFVRNYISEVLTDPSKSYDITYLDLVYNRLTDISNLTVLVNLRTLNLESNSISNLNASTFAGMRNLTVLYLGNNDIFKIEFKVFPKGLTQLWLMRSLVSDLDFTGAFLPDLTLLNLEANHLTTIDLPTLFAVCPALKIIPIAHNLFRETEAKRIIADLSRRNVSHYIAPGMGCSSDEFEVSNICFPGSVLLARSIWKAILLLVLAVVVVAIFVGSVRWIWFQMRY